MAKSTVDVVLADGSFGVASGRVQEARDYLEAMISQANHLGQFSALVDPRCGPLFGNFPQVFTHIGLLGPGLHFAYL